MLSRKKKHNFQCRLVQELVVLAAESTIFQIDRGIGGQQRLQLSLAGREPIAKNKIQ